MAGQSRVDERCNKKIDNVWKLIYFIFILYLFYIYFIFILYLWKLIFCRK